MDKFIFVSMQILEYRNGIYQGHTKGNKRNGYGMLINDDGYIMVGEWKNDLLIGKGFVFVDHAEYGYGEFNRGEIEGYFLFRKNEKSLFAEYNMSRPMNKMLFIDHDQDRVQVLVHRSPIYEVLQERGIERESEHQLISSFLNVNFPCPSLLTFLEKELGEASESTFLLKILQNGNFLFILNDKENPYSLGFVINKNQQLISYGLYMNEKLNGLGCKYENTVRYEGMFEGGFMNGIGLKFSQGKYSFGEFSNGNLINAVHIQQRSNASEERLKDFKREEHIRSLWFCNFYIKSNFIKYKGTKQLVFEANIQQEYLYPQSPVTKGHTKSKNIALKMINKQQFETKSSKSYLVRPPIEKNPEEPDDFDSQSHRSGFNPLGSLRKFKY